MESTPKTALRRLVLLLDGALVVLAMTLAFKTHQLLLGHVPWLKGTVPFRYCTLLVAMGIPLWLTLIAALGLHRAAERPERLGQLAIDLTKLHGLGLGGLALLLFLTQTPFNRSIVALFVTWSFTLLLIERAGLGAWLRYQYQTGLGRERILLVGDPSADTDAFSRAAAAENLPPLVVGLVSEAAVDSHGGGELRLLGRTGCLADVLHEHPVDRVLFFPPWTPSSASELIHACAVIGVPAEFAIDLGPPFQAPPRVVLSHGRPFLSFELQPRSPVALVLKHAIDLVAAILVLLISLPLTLLTALAIWVTMGRPILFVQARGGLNGRHFRMLKFRTMVRGAEQRRNDLVGVNEMSGPVFKLSNDPRVTRLGRLLRRTSLDELPQLWNVLRGEMSLVGPRPLPLEEQQQIRGPQRRRLSMRPGITGLWQVQGRNTIDFDDWMRLDLRYIDNWSLLLDVWILLRTIPAVLLRRGAR